MLADSMQGSCLYLAGLFSVGETGHYIEKISLPAGCV